LAISVGIYFAKLIVRHRLGEARSSIRVSIFVAIGDRHGRVAVELGLRRISSTLENALLALLWC